MVALQEAGKKQANCIKKMAIRKGGLFLGSGLTSNSDRLHPWKRLSESETQLL
jgi:hypothetical protein